MAMHGRSAALMAVQDGGEGGDPDEDDFAWLFQPKNAYAASWGERWWLRGKRAAFTAVHAVTVRNRGWKRVTDLPANTPLAVGLGWLQVRGAPR